jgi:hypothetical protein
MVWNKEMEQIALEMDLTLDQIKEAKRRDIDTILGLRLIEKNSR